MVWSSCSVKCISPYTSNGGTGACDLCLEGRFLADDGTCKTCPANAYCGGGATLPRPNEGYWSDRSRPHLAPYIYLCAWETCKGASDDKDACWTRRGFYNTSCDESKLLCTTGASGPLCGICDEGYTFSSSQKICVDCKSENSILTPEFVVCVLIVTAMFVGFFAIKKYPVLWSYLLLAVGKGKAKVFWSNLQIISSVRWTMDIVFPQPFAALVRIYEITELNPLGSLSLACADPTLGSFKTFALAVSLVPIGFILFLWAVYLARINIEQRRKNGNHQRPAITPNPGVELSAVGRVMGSDDAADVNTTDEEKQHASGEEEDQSPGQDEYRSWVQVVFNEHMQASMILIYLVYPTVSSAHFRSLVCTDFEDGSSFLRVVSLSLPPHPPLPLCCLCGRVCRERETEGSYLCACPSSRTRPSTATREVTTDSLSRSLFCSLPIKPCQSYSSHSCTECARN